MALVHTDLMVGLAVRLAEAVTHLLELRNPAHFGKEGEIELWEILRDAGLLRLDERGVIVRCAGAEGDGTDAGRGDDL